MRITIWSLTLAAALVPGVALAAPGTSGSLTDASPLALSIVTPDASTPATALNPSVVALTTPLVAPIRYRPGHYRGRGYVMPTTWQIHAGFMDPTDNFSTGFYGGFRGGPQVSPNVQIGVGVDWWHKSESQTVNIDQGPLPGGGTTERQLELSHSSVDLLPMLAFVQVSGDENLAVIPYGGAGIGYEVLFLSAEDFQTATSFDATYGGFGWQAWGGFGVPLSGQSRINAEVFYNGSEVGRDVEDRFSPVTFREIVKMNGVGVRVGLQWGF